MDILDITQKQIIVQNYQLIQAICFHQYLVFGRGILLFNYKDKNSVKCIPSKIAWNIPHDLGNFSAIYVSKHTSYFAEIFRGHWRGFASSIRSYNPKKSSIIAFYSKNSQEFDVYPLDDKDWTPSQSLLDIIKQKNNLNLHSHIANFSEIN